LQLTQAPTEQAEQSRLARTDEHSPAREAPALDARVIAILLP
jgi:hypothetical protein